MNIKDFFPEAECISQSEVRIQDTVAYPDPTSGMIILAEVGEIGTGGNVLSTTGNVIGGLADGYYLIHRPNTPLPTGPGDMVRITQDVRIREVIKAGTVLTCDSSGVYVAPNLRLSRTAFEEWSISWEQVWYTTNEPDPLVDAEVLEEEAYKPRIMPEEHGFIVQIMDHGTLPSTCVRTDIPHLMIKEANGLFVGVGPHGLMRLAPSDFDLYRIIWKPIWLTNKDPKATGPLPD